MALSASTKDVPSTEDAARCADGSVVRIPVSEDKEQAELRENGYGRRISDGGTVLILCRGCAN